MEVLDLHGTPHMYARNKVIRIIEDCWDKGKEISIITGMSNTMQKIVIDVLDEYKLSYRIGDGINYGFIKTQTYPL